MYHHFHTFHYPDKLNGKITYQISVDVIDFFNYYHLSVTTDDNYLEGQPI